jgi:hypothetical protein
MMDADGLWVKEIHHSFFWLRLWRGYSQCRNAELDCVQDKKETEQSPVPFFNLFL